MDFNPQIPATQDPNYFRYSDSISNLKPNQSKGIALEGAGNIGDAAVKLGDQYIKGNIDEKVNTFADKERSDFTGALESLKNGIVPNAVQTSSGGKALSFADESQTADLPPAITQGLTKLDSLTQAYGQGKVNDTYYTMRLDADVKALRAQYPGYRDYIDQRVAQNTGMNPANEYVKNLMQDINSKLTNKKTEADKIVDLARGALTTGLPGSQEQYQRLIADPSYAPKFLEWYSQANENKYKIDTDNAIRANRKGTKEEAAQDDTEKFTGIVGRIVATNLTSVVTIPGTDTPQGIMDFMQAVAAHPEQYSSTMLETLATRLKSQRAVLESQLRSMSDETRDGVPSYSQSIGVAKRDEIVKNQLGVYDAMYDAIKGGGPQGAGLAYWHANQAIARLNDRKDNISAGPIGEDLDNMQILTEKAGPAFSGMLIPQLLQANIDQKMRPYFNSKAVEARAQPDFDKTGKPITLQEHMQQANELEKKQQITSQMKGRYFNNLVNIVDDLKNPNVPDNIKSNVAKYLFSPEGQGILANIKTDYTDPQTGKYVPGKYSVFQRLTSDDVVQNVAKLAKSDPQIGKMYKNYLENEAGSQLFYKELQNLNHFTGHDDLHFAYDSDNHQITLLDKTGKTIPQSTPVVGKQFGIPYVGTTPPPKPDAGYIFQAQKIVNRINDGLAGLGRVEKGLGGDVNSYLLDFLQHSQVDLGKNWEGLPKKLVDAIAASRTPQRRIEDTFDNLRSK